jgi:diadenosine tetraphosphate (Ap4A) HIT family hydrolase
MRDCIFCDIYTNNQGIIYENKHFFARFDKFPVAPGHAEVIPKRHVVSLFDLTEQEWKSLKPAISAVITIIEATNFEELYQRFIGYSLNDQSVAFCEKMLTHVGINKKPDAYNIGVNDGEAAGRTIPHLHVHIIPRHQGDVTNPTGGIRNIIPGSGNYTS